MKVKKSRFGSVLTPLTISGILVSIVALPMVMQQAHAVCATYDSPNNRIIVSCNATLPQVASEINNPSIMEDKGNGEYVIRAILQTSHAKLTISSADGVSWLKFTGDNGLYFYYANAAISGVKITSWDESTNSTIDNKGTAARAWVRFYKTNDATITNSEFAYLGHGTDASSKRGISFEGTGSTNLHIDNSEFHHNHYAFYSNGLANSEIKNSNYHDNDLYDIDPHTGTNNMIIANNHVHSSQAKIGIICSLNCYAITIEGNTVENSATGITLSRNMHDSIVRNNQIFNVGTGISVSESPDNEIYGNTIHDVSRGIYFTTPSVIDDGISQNNFAHDNIISKATYGISSSNSPVNTVKNNKLDSASITYEYYVSGNSKLIIDSQKFNSDKIRGVSGTNPIEIRNSGTISIDGGPPIDTDATPYTTTLTNKIITVNTGSPTPSDTTRPAVKITKPTEGQTVLQGSVPVEGTSSDESGGSGIKTVQVRVDSGSYQTATPKAAGDWSTWSINLDITTLGAHKIQARATDNAGNQNWYSVNINVVDTLPEPTPADTTKPTVKITSPKTGDSLSGNSTVHVTGIASDDTGGSGLKAVQVHVDSGSYQAVTPNAPGDWSSWTIDLNITTAGTHRIQARATDNAGNQNWSTISVTIT